LNVYALVVFNEVLQFKFTYSEILVPSFFTIIQAFFVDYDVTFIASLHESL